MERKEERGWYTSTDDWTLVNNSNTTNTTTNPSNKIKQEQNDDEKNNNTYQKPVNEILYAADEERSKCRICSINFDMIFDNMASVFMCKNCVEMIVQSDDVSVDHVEEEKVLIHESCRRGLGCLDYLTMDQIMQYVVFLVFIVGIFMHMV